MVTVNYQNRGTCSVLTKVILNDDHTIADIAVEGGCNGNLKGICSLLKGQKAEDVIPRMQGIQCGRRPTSCPDQISKALTQALAQLG